MGFAFSSGEEPQVNTVVDIVALFVGTALVPPLIEEFAMRNVVMQPLRKYGNLFAIIASALVFGIFHGTPTQIPFAILCGLFLGYAVIATESIWTGVIIHSIVNGLSCCYYAIRYFTDEETADSIYSFICLGLAVLGFVALLIYISRYKDDFNRIISKNGLEEYSLKQKISKFIFAPVMFIAVIVFLLQAISMIDWAVLV
jgi:membrane protease YdiL (CAAX protease family)